MKRLTAALIGLAFFSVCSLAHAEAPLVPGAAYGAVPAQAMVLVAFKGDKKFTYLTLKGSDAKWTLAGVENGVYALLIKVGTHFSIATLGIPSAFATPEKTHTLTIAGPGIYCYGTVLSKKMHVDVTQECSKEHVALARQQFADVFKALKPVNFH